MESVVPAIKPKLLIIEDDPENQKLLQLYLKRVFEVTICDSEDSFHECLSRDSYDIFLVDISLRSGKNGLELTKELRQSKKYFDSPVICLSAHVFPKDKINAFEAGVDEFLTRPIYNQDLLSSLIEVYKQKTGRSIEA